MILCDHEESNPVYSKPRASGDDPSDHGYPRFTCT